MSGQALTNGRDGKGRFVKGNPGGPGNPFASKVGKFRAAILEAASVEDVASIMRTLISAAIGGDISAAKVVLGYLVGEPVPHDLIVRLDALEGALARTRELEAARCEAN